MTIEVTMKFSTAAEVVAFFSQSMPDLNPASEGSYDSSMAQAPLPNVATDRPRRGRPRKTETAQPAVAHVTPAVEAAPSPTGSDAGAIPRASDSTVVEPAPQATAVAADTVTIDAVREKLSEVVAKDGMAAAQALLAKFNARRVSDLKPEQYAAVLEAA